MSYYLRKYAVTEHYATVQGEGVQTGYPMYLIRLAGCDNNCRWCDTPLSHAVGKTMTAGDIVAEVMGSRIGEWVLLTGGNPCIWDCGPLIAGLRHNCFRVAVETQGTVLPVPKWLRRADWVTVSPKPPSSGNPTPIKAAVDYAAKLPLRRVACKVVVADRRDWEYAQEVYVAVVDFLLPYHMIVQPCAGVLPADKLARWVLESGQRMRVMTQMHKAIWPKGERK